ncbi:hypothetical protein CROQUDRAFT_73101 [Cronartium quercuum f. sp. fusiforme G11]|uniref:Uncharacterized protein n=1 Tax=Cronartium quercuum f. sp. fusiforme G11 TaxID=708437 RepID=A0A9P6TF56_9BASI|nr:hypothetical protein CROQUDRAFT_73101 [Cronartium quercuum f. sp. fusiforme G11]
MEPLSSSFSAPKHNDIPIPPSPFVHGWASVNPQTYLHGFPDLTNQSPPQIIAASPPKKKPKPVTPFMPKAIIKPTTLQRPNKVPSNSDNSLSKPTNPKVDEPGKQGASDDGGWGLASPGNTTQASIAHEWDVLMAEDVTNVPEPINDPSTSTAAETERKEFETELRFEPDLLETIVRATLLSKEMLDRRRRHEKTVTVLNSYKASTAGLHPDHSTLYETHLATTVKAVEAVQAQLNSTLKLLDKDVWLQLEELTAKHDRLLSEPTPVAWVPKQPVKGHSAISKIHPSRTRILTAAPAQEIESFGGDDGWGTGGSKSNDVADNGVFASGPKPSNSGADDGWGTGTFKSRSVADGSGFGSRPSNSSTDLGWDSGTSKPNGSADQSGFSSKPSNLGSGQNPGWSGGGDLGSFGQRGRGSFRGGASDFGSSRGGSFGRGRGRGGNEMGGGGSWGHKENQDSFGGRSNGSWGGNKNNDNVGGGRFNGSWGGNNDNDNIGGGRSNGSWGGNNKTENVGGSFRGRGRGRGRGGSENGSDSAWGGSGSGRGGFHGGGSWGDGDAGSQKGSGSNAWPSPDTFGSGASGGWGDAKNTDKQAADGNEPPPAGGDKEAENSGWDWS